MTQTDVVKELIVRELSELKKDLEVKKALSIVNRIKRVKTADIISIKGKDTIKKLHKDYVVIKRNPTVKRALILNSILN